MDLYNTLPRKSIIREVCEIFYEKVYDHEWISRFFKDVTKEHITKQQTHFVTAALGGPKLYCGRLAKDAHVHMLITEELFELRKSMLVEALDEAHAPVELKERWLRIDEGFRRGMVKTSVTQCTKRYFSDTIKAFKNPKAGPPRRRSA